MMRWQFAHSSAKSSSAGRVLAVTIHCSCPATWSDLKAWAAGADVAFAISQIQATATHRKIFEGVKAAAKAAGIAATDTDTVGLIQSIDVAPFDFDLAKSTNHETAVGNARTLLAINTLDEGRKLWNELVTRAREARLGSGTLDTADLRRSLRSCRHPFGMCCR